MSTGLLPGKPPVMAAEKFEGAIGKPQIPGAEKFEGAIGKPQIPGDAFRGRREMFAGTPEKPALPEGFAGAPPKPDVPEMFAGMAAKPDLPEAFGGMTIGAPYGAEGGAMNGRRSFTVMSSTAKGASGGTYLSTAPLNAAKKAARQLFAKSATRTNKIKFVLRETTRGSKKKTYKYVATKKKLSPPKTVMRGNVKIVLKHEYEVKADN